MPAATCKAAATREQDPEAARASKAARAMAHVAGTRARLPLALEDNGPHGVL